MQEPVANHLSSYMIPAVWIGLDTMPQNSNGKIDKKALQVLDVVVNIDAPVTDADKRMAAVWAQVLDVDVGTIGRQTSFFAIGGDSMTAIQVVAVCKIAGIYITVHALLEASSLCHVATRTSTGTTSSLCQIDATVNGFDSDSNGLLLIPTTYDQKEMLLSFNSLWCHTFCVLQNVDRQRFLSSLKVISREREILRTSFITIENHLYQRVELPQLNVVVDEYNVSSLDDFYSSTRTRYFDETDVAYSRFSIVQMDDTFYAFLTNHHALYDGWSIPMLLQIYKMPRMEEN